MRRDDWSNREHGRQRAVRHGPHTQQAERRLRRSSEEVRIQEVKNARNTKVIAEAHKKCKMHWFNML